MPRSIGQGARARHWPVHDPKTQSPAAATLLKLTRLSENGLAAIGAVTPPCSCVFASYPAGC